MQYNRPIVLSIAGYDPSGGAGVLADIKTFEQHECLGMAVLTGITVQTEHECSAVEWQSGEQIRNALIPLLKTYDIQWVKIGMIESIDVLLQICLFLKTKNPSIHIIWDSVLCASSGFSFIRKWNFSELSKLYSMLYLVTPNANELAALTGIDDEITAAKSISTYCSLLLTGGHRKTNKGKDVLFYKQRTISIEAGTSFFYDKHGTGCILSAAIIANIAKGFSLEEACRRAKTYTEKVANRNINRLAYHHDPKK